MLTCEAKEMVFSSYAGNIYEVQESPVRKDYTRNCRVIHLPDGEIYRLYVLDYYVSFERGISYRNWMENNFEECFGGRTAENLFIWPVDYVSEYNNSEDAASLGLFFTQKQFEGQSEAKRLLERKNAVALLLPLFHAVDRLHKQNFCLNGIDLKQLYVSDKDRKVKIQVFHNCIYREGVGIECSGTMTDDARYLYQEKAFSLPLGSHWGKLNLGTYALCNDVYSLATILFYALTGRHPLNGRLCDDQEDEEGRKVIYNQNPCFIFDKEDTRNSIGQFEQEKLAIERWSTMNPKLKELFWQLYSFPVLEELEAETKANELECFQMKSWIDALQK